MNDKISIAISGIGDISDAIKAKVTAVFDESGATSWTQNLVYNSPFLILKPKLSDFLNNVAILQDLFNLMNEDDYAIAIYYNVDTKNKDDIKFSIIHHIIADDDEPIAISHTPEDENGAASSLRSDSFTEFLNYFSSDNYALGFFILLKKDELFPSFTIKDFSGATEVDKTFSLRDLIGYLYCVHSPNPYIHTQKYALNLIAIRSNWGYEQDTNDNNKWKYKKREHFRDWLIIFFIGSDGKWQLKQYGLTTFPDNSIISGKDTNGFFIMPKGRHINVYNKDIHTGASGAQHLCLKQVKKITHYRDTSSQQSTYYDFDNLVEPTFTRPDGKISAVNIHTTHSAVHHNKGFGDTIGKYSNGCQVVPTASHSAWGCNESQINADSFMKLVKNQIDNCSDSEVGDFKKDYFTYFLIEAWDLIQYAENNID